MVVVVVEVVVVEEEVLIVDEENDDSFSTQLPSQQQISPLLSGSLWQSPFLYNSDSYSQHPQSLKMLTLIDDKGCREKQKPILTFFYEFC